MINFTLEDNTDIIYDSNTNQLLRDNIPFEINNNLSNEFYNNNIHLDVFFGDQCNFNCQYCHQAKNNIFNQDIDKFCNDVRTFIQDKTVSFTFFGGEPFVYFDYIKEICNQLKDKINTIEFTTNGSFLGNEYVFNWIKDNLDIIKKISVSYDGPGQFLRGPDILDNVNIKNNILYLIENNKLMFFGVVTNKEFYTIFSYKNYLQNKLNVDISNIPIYLTSVFVCNNDIISNYLLDESQLIEFYKDLYNSLFENNNFKYNKNLLSIIKRFNKCENTTNFCTIISKNKFSCNSNGKILLCPDCPDREHIINRNEYYKDLSMLEPTVFPTRNKDILLRHWKEYCKDCEIKYICQNTCTKFWTKNYRKENCLSFKYKYLFHLICIVTLLSNNRKVKEIQFI